MTTENQYPLEQLSELDSILMHTTKIDIVLDIRHRIKAMAEYARNIKASKELSNKIIAARLRSERKAGQILMDMGLVGNNQHSQSSGATTLKQMNISKDQSSDWQKIGEIPEETFDDWLLGSLQSDSDLSTRGFLRRWHIEKHGSKKADNGNDGYTPPDDLLVRFGKYMFVAGMNFINDNQDSSDKEDFADRAALKLAELIAEWKVKQNE